MAAGAPGRSDPCSSGGSDGNVRFPLKVWGLVVEFDFAKYEEDASRRASAEAGERLSGLLGDNRELLEALDYPGTTCISPTRRIYKRNLSPFARQRYRVIEVPLGERRAWCFPMERVPGTYPARYEHWALGIDGACYHWQGDWRLNDASAGLIDRMILFLERLLRAHSPEQAPTVEVELLGATFVATPRPVLETPQQREAYAAELRCEDPAEASDGSGVVGSDLGAGIQPADRSEQLRYLFMSWLDLITVTGAAAERARPDLFFEPAPTLPGGPATRDELVAIVKVLLAQGDVEWIENLQPPRDSPLLGDEERFEESQPLWPLAAQLEVRMFGGQFHSLTRWRLILTDDGRRALHRYHQAMSTTDRTRAVRAAVLRWVARRAKEPHTVALPQFLASTDAVVDGIAVSAPDVYRAARWLVTRGFIHMPQNALPGTSVDVSLTRQGLVCREQYGGDPWTMSEAQRRGEDRRSFHASDGGIINVESSVGGQIGKLAVERIDVSSLVGFARAVAEALPGLPIPSPEKSTASATTAEILKEASIANPDHPKLKALGSALHTMVEGAANGAGSALATALLGMWHP